MNKMFKEIVKTIKLHPDMKYTFNEYWDIDNFKLELDELNSIVVTQENKHNKINITYWHYDEHSGSKCLEWNEDECLVGRSYSDDKKRIDPEQAYFQIAESLGLFK